MAQVAPASTTHAPIDLLLGHASEAWQRLPRVAAEIDEWDAVDQVRFIEEWPLEEQRLCRLETFATSGAMSAAQQLEFRRLMEVVRENRPIIERLQRSE